MQFRYFPIYFEAKHFTRQVKININFIMFAARTWKNAAPILHRFHEPIQTKHASHRIMQFLKTLLRCNITYIFLYFKILVLENLCCTKFYSGCIYKLSFMIYHLVFLKLFKEAFLRFNHLYNFFNMSC